MGDISLKSGYLRYLIVDNEKEEPDTKSAIKKRHWFETLNYFLIHSSKKTKVYFYLLTFNFFFLLAIHHQILICLFDL